MIFRYNSRIELCLELCFTCVDLQLLFSNELRTDVFGCLFSATIIRRYFDLLKYPAHPRLMSPPNCSHRVDGFSLLT